VPQARVLSYGYDARTSGDTPLSEQYFHDHAYELIGSLAMEREMTDVRRILLRFQGLMDRRLTMTDQTEMRPIIFIARSLGGIVLKEASILEGGISDSLCNCYIDLVLRR
jgi:hypothetical protein